MPIVASLEHLLSYNQGMPNSRFNSYATAGTNIAQALFLPVTVLSYGSETLNENILHQFFGQYKTQIL